MSKRAHLVAVRSGEGAHPPDARTDASLVDAARGGEGWAKEELFRRHARMVFGMAARLLGRDDDDVDDLAQESFVHALASFDRLKNAAAFPSWLGAIVVRTAYKTLRRRSIARRIGLRPREPSADVDSLVSPDAPADVQLELKTIFGILEDLPTNLRVALVLRRVEGASLDEIALYMDTSPRSAKRWVDGAEARLAQALGGTPGDDDERSPS